MNKQKLLLSSFLIMTFVAIAVAQNVTGQATNQPGTTSVSSAGVIGGTTVVLPNGTAVPSELLQNFNQPSTTAIPGGTAVLLPDGTRIPGELMQNFNQGFSLPPGTITSLPGSIPTQPTVVVLPFGTSLNVLPFGSVISNQSVNPFNTGIFMNPNVSTGMLQTPSFVNTNTIVGNGPIQSVSISDTTFSRQSSLFPLGQGIQFATIDSGSTVVSESAFSSTTGAGIVSRSLRLRAGIFQRSDGTFTNVRGN